MELCQERLWPEADQDGALRPDLCGTGRRAWPVAEPGDQPAGHGAGRHDELHLQPGEPSRLADTRQQRAGVERLGQPVAHVRCGQRAQPVHDDRQRAADLRPQRQPDRGRRVQLRLRHREPAGNRHRRRECDAALRSAGAAVQDGGRRCDDALPLRRRQSGGRI